MAEPIIELGTSIEIDENTSGNLVLKHTPSGETVTLDSSGLKAQPIRQDDVGLAQSGFLRISNNGDIAWRNNTDDADNTIGFDGFDHFYVRRDGSADFLVRSGGNADLRGNSLEQVGGLDGTLYPITHLTKDSNQSLASGGFPSLITWETAQEDDGGWFDNTNDSIVVDTDGLYHMKVKLTLGGTNDGTGLFYIQTELNGNQFHLRDLHRAEANDVTNVATTTEKLTAGDEITVKAYQNTGNDQNIRGDDVLTHFQVYRLKK